MSRKRCSHQGVALTLLYPLCALAQGGLPHEVVNMTQPGPPGSPDVPGPHPPPVPPPARPPPIVTVTQSWTLNMTTTESWTTTQQCPTSSSSRKVYTTILPSPDASPIEVTAQNQVLTSYIPEMTWCVAPPMALSAVAPPYPNATTTNYTTIIAGTDHCETQYTPVVTTICATTLTGLASRITVTDCDQEVTFSTECGITWETPSPVTKSASLVAPAPIPKQMYTYWLAPWQSLTAGETPSDVDVKICTDIGDSNLECIRYQEVWEVVLVTKTLTTTRPIGLSATLTGPGIMIIQTDQVFITNTTKIVDLSTTLLLETEIETESTSTGRKSPISSALPTVSSTSTLFVTKTVHHKVSRCAHEKFAPRI